VALLDYQMPAMDGLALARALRAARGPESLPLVLLSSIGGTLSPAQGDATFTAVLSKPVKLSLLHDRLLEVLAGPQELQATRIGTRPSDAQSGPLRILLAEDNEINQTVALRLLERLDQRADVAANGHEVMHRLDRATYDVILMDVQMPGMDGLETSRAVCRRWPVGQRPRIIAMTAEAMEGDRERCLAAGMDDYLIKPVAAAALLAAIDRLVSTHQVSQPDQADAAPSGSLLDPVAVLTACGDDAEGLRRMCEDFQTYAPARLAELGDALRDRDAPRLRQAAHKFCPLLLTFSTVAGNVASELEDNAAQGQLEEARTLVARLETMAEELLRLVGAISLDALRGQAGTAAEPGRTAGL
jgi:CheY-like chemotaxis protein